MTQSKRKSNPAPSPEVLLAHTITAPNGCFVWTKEVAHNGYGVYRWSGNTKKTHRLMAGFLVQNPDNKPWVLHSCDNPPCINPDHLRWGTAKENAQDRDSKQRGVVPNNKGSLSGNAKLKEQQVMRIKQVIADGARGIDIAAEFGISKGTVSNIKYGTSWGHLKLSD